MSRDCCSVSFFSFIIIDYFLTASKVLAFASHPPSVPPRPRSHNSQPPQFKAATSLNAGPPSSSPSSSPLPHSWGRRESHRIASLAAAAHHAVFCLGLVREFVPPWPASRCARGIRPIHLFKAASCMSCLARRISLWSREPTKVPTGILPPVPSHRDRSLPTLCIGPSIS